MRCLTLFLLFLLPACDPGEVVLLAPDKSPSDAPALTIHAVVDTPYTDVAAALGWTAGVPQAQVRVHLMKEPYDETYWHVATADSAGIATFTDLLTGLYEVQVARRLTTAEMVQADSALHVLAGGRRLQLLRGAEQELAEHEVTAAPDHRGALVFSELSMDYLGALDGRISGDARYFEVYNNSDSTIYLDGKLWGIGWYLIRDYSPWPCDQTVPLRNDPEGIWAHFMFRFPGAGTEYPLPSGMAALVAKAAIDHRVVDSRLLDLSAAEFEWGGEATADNPDVPNLEEIGFRATPNPFPAPGEMPEFLADPVDLQTLPRYTDPFSGTVWVRIPREQVLDAWVSPTDWTTHSYEPEPPCLEDLHRNFERLAGPAAAHYDFANGLSVQRRVLMVLPNGRKVLQDTDTSMEDFVKAPRSPGWIPDSLGH